MEGDDGALALVAQRAIADTTLRLVVATAAATAATAATVPTVKKQQITLKKHKDVLYEMYKVAKHKANEMKRAAMRAYLEAKEIKAKYLLDDLDDYSSDDDTNK